MSIIKADEITKIEAETPTHLTAFKGTMKVHEWTWSKEQPTIIQFRRLTCRDCNAEKTCTHFGLGKMLIAQIKLNYYDVYSGSSGENDEITVAAPTNCQEELSVGDFVAASYNGREYPGIIKILQDLKLLVSCMESIALKTRLLWRWPKNEDLLVLEYSREDIRKIQPPTLIQSTKRGTYCS